MNLRLSLFAVLALAACGSNDPRPASAARFSPRIDHPYFPLTPGLVWTYVGSHGTQLRHERVESLSAQRWIDGVACTAIVQEIEHDAVLEEVTTEWFAQDQAGNVWKFGEETLVPNGSGFSVIDSWVAGVGAGKAWIAFPTGLRAGLRFASSDEHGAGEFEVRTVEGHVTVAAGTYDNCAEIVEKPGEPDADIILYAPGVGRVHEVNAEGKLELESVRRE